MGSKDVVRSKYGARELLDIPPFKVPGTSSSRGSTQYHEYGVRSPARSVRSDQHRDRAVYSLAPTANKGYRPPFGQSEPEAFRMAGPAPAQPSNKMYPAGPGGPQWLDPNAEHHFYGSNGKEMPGPYGSFQQQGGHASVAPPGGQSAEFVVDGVLEHGRLVSLHLDATSINSYRDLPDTVLQELAITYGQYAKTNVRIMASNGRYQIYSAPLFGHGQGQAYPAAAAAHGYQAAAAHGHDTHRSYYGASGHTSHYDREPRHHNGYTLYREVTELIDPMKRLRWKQR